MIMVGGAGEVSRRDSAPTNSKCVSESAGK